MCESESTRYRKDIMRVLPEDRRPPPREIRNGLPDFRPYVYRGTGEDQCPETTQHSGPQPGRRAS